MNDAVHFCERNSVRYSGFVVSDSDFFFCAVVMCTVCDRYLSGDVRISIPLILFGSRMATKLQMSKLV